MVVGRRRGTLIGPLNRTRAKRLRGVRQRTGRSTVFLLPARSDTVIRSGCCASSRRLSSAGLPGSSGGDEPTRAPPDTPTIVHLSPQVRASTPPAERLLSTTRLGGVVSRPVRAAGGDAVSALQSKVVSTREPS